MIFGNLGNMGEMLKQAKQMQEELKKIKNELAAEFFEEERGGVKARVSGEMEVKEIKIDPRLLQSNNASRAAELTQDAVNGALKKAKDFATHKLRKLTGGLSIPGLF